MTTTQEFLTASPRAERYIAFDGFRRLADGDLHEVARSAKLAADRGMEGSLYVVDATTSQPLELDLRGPLADVLSRLPEASAELDPRLTPDATPRGPGRPRLGVVAREVTLLPRHWTWLADQPGGASAALRRLVDQARVANEGRDALRHAQESAYRFMSTLLGDQPDFDEAARALFAGNGERFDTLVEDWPADARGHLLELAAVVFSLK